MNFLSRLLSPKERPLPRVMQKMEVLVALATGVLLYTVMEEIGVDRTRDPTERERLGQRAAYLTRLLLGEPLRPKDTEQNAEVEARNAAVFLEQQWMMMELVVQTLRVKNTVHFARHGTDAAPPIGVETLKTYGSKVRNEPDPDSYEALVQSAMDAMSDIGKARMASFMKDNGIR